MKNRKLKTVVTIMTMMSLALGGCGNVAQSDVIENEEVAKAGAVADVLEDDLQGTNITFWHSMGGSGGEAIDYLVNKFNTENKYGITVTSEYQGSYDDALTKLKSAQLGNMGADLVQVYEIGTRFMIDSGWIVPMQELIDIDGWDVAKLEPNIAAYYTINDKLYSMPFNTSTPILYYNKNILEKAGIAEDSIPTSFDEILSSGEDILTKGEAKTVFALGNYGWFFEQLICKQGLHYVDAGNGREDIATKVEFDTNGAGLNIVSAWHKLNQKGYAPNLGRGTSDAQADFCAGNAAFYTGSTASLKQILTDVNGTFEVGTAYFPAASSEDQGGVSIGGASLWALDNYDDIKKKATWEFVKFLVSAESQAYWNVQTGYFPVTVDAYNEEILKENMETYPQFMTAVNQLHDSSAESQGALISVFSEARDIVESEMENMLNGLATPEEVVNAMAARINVAIEEYNLLNN